MTFLQKARPWSCVLFAFGFVVGGCRSAKPVFTDVPTISVFGTPTGGTNSTSGARVFRVGDWVTVHFAEIVDTPWSHAERIKEGGTITLPRIGSVVAAGKTAREIEEELQQKHAELHKRFRVGDLVTIRFDGFVNGPSQPHEERIKEDGTITPPDIGSVLAVGKTAAELAEELEEKYARIYEPVVPYGHRGHYYYVGGEVKAPGPKEYLSETTVLKAIQAAGDFNEYADKRKVKLIHADGRSEIIEVRKAIKELSFDRPVYPQDRIEVPQRRAFFGF